MGRVIDRKSEIRNRKLPCRVTVLLVTWYWMLPPSTTEIVEMIAEFIQLSAEGLAPASGSFDKDGYYIDRSSDYSVSSDENIRRDCETDLFGGFEIGHDLELHRLLDGKIGGLGALEYFIKVRHRQ
jgi:hypothetical protein